MKDDLKIGLVLSGGGSRGSFQVGVWQALVDLGLSGNIISVYGTSVGAINGAAIVQDDFQLALDIWHEITYSKVFAHLPQYDSELSKRKLYLNWMRGAFLKGGLDVSPLKDLLREVIDEQIIRDSDLDYGMVVFDLTEKRAKYMVKESIPTGKLTEYVIASSTFPGFQPHRIEDHLYIDGGIYDNRPISFLRNDQDVNTIIVVDVTMARHIWPKKRVRNKVDILYVRPSRLLGSPLAFNHRRIMSNMELGYQNALIQLAGLAVEGLP